MVIRGVGNTVETSNADGCGAVQNILQTLQEVSGYAAVASPDPAVLDQMLAKVCEVVAAARLAIYRLSGDGETLEIGAMTRQRDLESSDSVKRLCPLMDEALPQIGHRQTRNRGTIGGSLSHLDPAAELPAVCAATDAVIQVQGPNGRR